MAVHFRFLASLLLTTALIFGCGPSRSGNVGGGNNGAAPTPTPGPALCPTGPMTCVLLTWTASTTPNVGYHVWYGTASRQYTVELDAGTNVTYQVTGLSPQTYYFAVTAYNANGDSGYSNEAGGTIPLTTLDQIEKSGETYVQEQAVTIPPHHSL
jgi:hypothetical protein